MLSTSFTAAIWTAIVAPTAWAAMLLVLYRGSRTERFAICPQRAARQAASGRTTSELPAGAGTPLPRQAAASRETLAQL